MPQLTEVLVEEVSLVDRPAIGRRFRIFKRGTPARWWENIRGPGKNGLLPDASPEDVPLNKRSGSAVPGDAEPEWEAILKQVEGALEAVAQGMEALLAQSQATQERLEAALQDNRDREAPGAATRQSLDPAGTASRSMWKGVL